VYAIVFSLSCGFDRRVYYTVVFVKNDKFNGLRSRSVALQRVDSIWEQKKSRIAALVSQAVILLHAIARDHAVGKRQKPEGVESLMGF